MTHSIFCVRDINIRLSDSINLCSFTLGVRNTNQTTLKNQYIETKMARKVQMNITFMSTKLLLLLELIITLY